MAQIREIVGQIKSVKNTQKITKAMELVASSKMRKAQERMQTSKPYSEKIRQVIAHVAASHSEYKHPYLLPREQVKRVGFIVVSTDRGLCGGLNVNLFRKVVAQMHELDQQNIEIDLCLVGRKGESFFRRHGGNVVGLASNLGEKPAVSDVVGVVKVMLDRYDAGDVDEIFVASNDFVNTMIQKPQVRKLLPLVPDVDDTQKGHWDYIYEPDSARELLTQLLVRYIESQVYQAVIENVSCEQSARMVAMKSATDNANELIDNLQLIYNKARQASITQEISEIVSGAEAVE